MFVIAGLGAFFVLWLRKSMPESPRWLESKGRIEEADAIVRGAEAQAGAALAALPIRLRRVEPEAIRLISPAFIKPVIVGSILQAVLGIAIYGFVAWVPTFLVQHGMAINRSLGQSVLMSLGGPAGAALGWLLSDRIGRRKSIIAASLLAAACGPAFAAAPSQELAILLGFLMFTLIYFMVAVIIAGYVPELFPTAVRMRGNGICATVGRLTTIFVPFGVVALFNDGGVASVVLGVSGALVVQALLAWTYKTETNGRSLEAIATTDSGSHAAVEKLT
jgi:putative MFS transporter